MTHFQALLPKVEVGSKARLAQPRWLIVVITLLAFAVRVIGLGWQSLWYDEAFSLVVAGVEWSTFWSALLADAVHPPGYYLLLRVGLALWGQSEFALRFTSLIAGTLAVPLIYQLGRRLGGWRWGMTAALLLALNPFAVWYAQEGRMYSLLLGLTAASSYAFWQLLKRFNWQSWIALTLVMAFGFITHYFAFIVSLVQFVYLALHIRRFPQALRWWTLAQVAAFLPFTPWAWAVATREGRNFGIGWIHAPGLLDLPLTFSNLAFLLSQPASLWTWTGLALFVVSVGGATVWLSSQTQNDSHHPARSTRSTFLWLGALLPPLFVWLISLKLPLYVDRQFIITLPALLLLLSAVSLAPLKTARLSVMTLALVSAIALTRLWFDPALRKEDWRAAASLVQQAEQPTDALLMRDYQTSIAFGYYYQGVLVAQAISLNRDTTPPDELIAGRQRIWLVYRRRFEPTHEVAGARPFTWQDDVEDSAVRTWLLAHQSALRQEVTLPGVYILLYEPAADSTAAGY